MTIDQLMTNTTMSINFIIRSLRKQWEHIGKNLYKSTMGKCHCLY